MKAITDRACPTSWSSSPRCSATRAASSSRAGTSARFDEAGGPRRALRAGQPLASRRAACCAGCTTRSGSRRASSCAWSRARCSTWRSTCAAARRPSASGSASACRPRTSRMLWVPEGFAHGFLVLSRTRRVPLQDHRLLRARARAHAPLERPGARHRLAARGRAAAEAQGRGGHAARARRRPSRDARAGHRRRAARWAPSSRASLAGRARGRRAYDRATLDLADPDAHRAARARRAARRDRECRRPTPRSTTPRASRGARARGQRRGARRARRGGEARRRAADPLLDRLRVRRHASARPTSRPIATEPARASTARTKLEGERAIAAARLPPPDPAHELGLRPARQELPAHDAAPRPQSATELRVVDDQRGAPTSSRAARAPRARAPRSRGDIDESRAPRSTAAREAASTTRPRRARPRGSASRRRSSRRRSAARAWLQRPARWCRSRRATTRRRRGARPTRCCRTRKLRDGLRRARIADWREGLEEALVSPTRPEPPARARARSTPRRRGWPRAPAR